MPIARNNLGPNTGGGTRLSEIPALETRTPDEDARRGARDEVHKAALRFLSRLRARGETILLRDQVHGALEAFNGAESAADPDVARGLARLIRGCQEIFFSPVYDYLLLRPQVGKKRIVRSHPDQGEFEEVSRAEYLRVKDAFIQGEAEAAKSGLTIDFAPFFQNYPKTRESAAIGAGISVLNRHLAGSMYQHPHRFRAALTDFLHGFHLNNLNLLTNDHITSEEVLVRELEAVLEDLDELDPEESGHALLHTLRVRGFEAGWGRNTSEVRGRLVSLLQVLESADAERLERLLSELPMTRTVVMISPHGWFAQQDVLGRPDTGGQVNYVLDQTRALDRALQQRFSECGLAIRPHIIILTRLIPDAEGTTCDQVREKVIGSDNCWILRVPFRKPDGRVHRTWVSRFHLWPYLEAFTLEARDALVAEFRGVPDLIIGHYSDGNLVAHRIADELQTVHCAAVHALEKTKYLLSDMHWADMEDEYNFSCQFTADLIAYNAADFIICSSYREVGGTETEMGMFENYDLFSMPGLYRVVSGMELSLARYNIVPPGASEDHFFPAAEHARRKDSVQARLEQLFFSPEPPPECVGSLADPELPPIFAMSRVDRVKNLPGLIEAYGKSEELRAAANLVVMSSLTRIEASHDQEERDQLHRIYGLIERYGLEGSIRWCGGGLNKIEAAEAYRVMADRRGVFAQPAFMETFGLTVIEAMVCGLPVVVTCFGGPAEIVEHERSGEVVNPNDHERLAGALRGIVSDRERWERYSREGIERVRANFHWDRHAASVLRMANTYAFWDHLNVMNRQALDQYIHTLYHTVYRPRAVAAMTR